MRHVDPSVSYSSYVDRELLDPWAVVNQLPTYEPNDTLRARKTGTRGRAFRCNSVRGDGPRVSRERHRRPCRKANEIKGFVYIRQVFS